MAVAAPVESLLARAQAYRSLPEPFERRKIRERAGLSQSDLARALGVSAPALSRWEAGARVPRRDHLIEYVGLLEKLVNDEDLGYHPEVFVKTSTAGQGHHGRS